ncbi:MAG: BON domain-containing protein [Acidobacteriia bacterium]|nr:BON domain-containing protein [Terriglobia bacterium]
MRTPTILITLTFLILFGFLAGCSQTGSTTAASAPPAMTDTDLQHSIQSRLNADPDLSVAKLDVDADVKNNTVTLKGTVPTETARLRAVELAKAGVPANLAITDKIDVKPAEISRSEFTDEMARDAREKAKTAGDKLGTSINDAWIHTKITSKLISDRDTPVRKINIDVVDGVVTLRGEVKTATAKDEADRSAMDTEGVKRVRNLLKITAG